MEQASDFVAESEALHALIADLPETAFARETQFKRWTIGQILQHLHYFNRMALLSLQAPDDFHAEYAIFAEGRAVEGAMLAITDQRLDGLSGIALRDAWIKTARTLEAPFAATAPKTRVPWAGPEMSARSAITARLMETWAHGQAIWDLLGQTRTDHDRIRNIAHLGVATFGWTYQVRKTPTPDIVPHVRLTAPSGAIWDWGTPSTDERIEGPATDFCQVVTQTRNFADVSLSVNGPIATQWMAWAQCFAGPPSDPPPPGARFTACV